MITLEPVDREHLIETGRRLVTATDLKVIDQTPMYAITRGIDLLSAGEEIKQDELREILTSIISRGHLVWSKEEWHSFDLDRLLEA